MVKNGTGKVEVMPKEEQEETALMLPARIYPACVAIKEATRQDHKFNKCAAMMDDLEKRLKTLEEII
jgi:hypothetical protein